MASVLFSRARPLGVAALAAGALLLASLPGSAEAQQDKRVRLDNRTDHVIVAVYARAAGRSAWTPNIIKGRRIRAGAGLTINFGTGSGGCKYDVRVVFETKDEQSNRGIDVCRTGVLRYE